MSEFLAAAFGFPTVIFTALLGVVLFYWALAIIGLVDFTHHGLDVDLDVDPNIHTHLAGVAVEISTLASYVVAMGLNGVPFSVVVSLVVLFAWTFACIASAWLMPLIPTTVLRAAAGLGVAVAAVAISIVLTARAVRPLRPLFVTHGAKTNASLVGLPCKVVTGSVDHKVGRAEVQQRGAAINVRVWAATPNAFTRGSSARLVEYDAASARYRIETGIDTSIDTDVG
jgi:hypothetical protein